jgi:HSP20 family protein
MSTMLVDPTTRMWADACALLERAEELRRQFFRPVASPTHEANWEPPVDVLETAREFWIIAALPGVEASDLDVTMEGDVLRIRGLRRLPATPGAAIRRLEIPHGRFERRIRLSGGRLELTRSELAYGCLYLGLAKRS